MSRAYRTRGERGVRLIPLAALPPAPPQKICDPGEVAVLARLMHRPTTVLPAIIVTNCKRGLVILDGHNRVAAARACRRFTHVPARVSP